MHEETLFSQLPYHIHISHQNTEDEGSIHPDEPGENATGLYRKTFKIPDKWIHKDSKNVKKHEIEKTFIIFEGVDCCANFYVDGVYVGFSKDSCLPCEFDITDILTENSEITDHILAVQVKQ